MWATTYSPTTTTCSTIDSARLDFCVGDANGAYVASFTFSFGSSMDSKIVSTSRRFAFKTMDNLRIVPTLFLLLLGTPISLAGQKSLSGKQLREIKVYVQMPNGEMLPVPKEIAFVGTENLTASADANPRTVMEVVRLPQAKAVVRFSQGEPIELFAEMPQSVDPRQLELFHFGSSGKQRIVYLEPFRNSNKSQHWNTVRSEPDN